ncbi:MAG: four helix bundle protein [Candidatus Celaenobacter antarcticus]|nr:four helix bundle protein [Candidatus Celaenobacter antarcticus]
MMKEKNRENKQKKFDLQERLVDYAIRCGLPSPCLVTNTRDTSPASNYGEAQSTESKLDFIYKLKIALQDLRETEVKWILEIQILLFQYINPIIIKKNQRKEQYESEIV